jgi:hypothetical protein
MDKKIFIIIYNMDDNMRSFLKKTQDIGFSSIIFDYYYNYNFIFKSYKYNKYKINKKIIKDQWKTINCNKNIMIHNIHIYSIYNNTNYCVCSCGNFDFINNS